MKRLLIVGVGALGGTIAVRAISARIPVWLATNSTGSANTLRSTGLQVSGVGGNATVSSVQVAPLEQYQQAAKFDLILLATKAHAALEIAPFLGTLLSPGGTLLPIQNGSAPELIASRLGENTVLGGLSNIGATMIEPGIYEQRNAGHLLIGELSGGISDRAEQISGLLGKAVEVRVSKNMRGAIWSKLLLNCSVTTIGAICGQSMRQYMASRAGQEVFRRTYDEALSTALATGVQPERMIVDPIPPGWKGNSVSGNEYDAWIDQVMRGYGDLKSSMLQDFEHGRRTEIDFINGYVAQVGGKAGVPVSMNAAITNLVHLIEQGRSEPHPARLEELLEQVEKRS
jgi:2-dehydropantoate 2-reductase